MARKVVKANKKRKARRNKVSRTNDPRTLKVPPRERSFYLKQIKKV